MKRHISYVVGASVMVAMLLGGCRKTAFDRSEGEETGRQPVQFSSAAGADKEESVATKVTGNSFDEGEVIGIYAYPSAGTMFGTGEDTRQNVPYSVLGGAKKGQLTVASEGENGVEVKPIYFPTDKSKWLNFRGYYPYSKDMLANGVLAVNVADQSAGQDWAILYSNNQNNVATTAEFIRLEFEYVMAQVVINLKYDPATGETVERSVTGVALEGMGLRTACAFSVETGTVSEVAGGGAADARGRIVLKPGMATTRATVVPGMGLTSGLEILVATRGGRTYVAKPKDVTFLPGRQYIYNVTLKGGGEVEIVGDGQATVLPWEMGNDGDALPPIVGEQEN